MNVFVLHHKGNKNKIPIIGNSITDAMDNFFNAFSYIEIPKSSDKFRAWDIKNKKMILPSEITALNFGPEGEIKSIKYSANESRNKTLLQDKFILMRYAKKDVDNKEVFEYDKIVVLREDSIPKYEAYVYFAEGAFCTHCEHPAVNAGEALFNWPIKVIGNIFEDMDRNGVL